MKNISWKELTDDLVLLGEKIHKKHPKKFKHILALTRGGLIPAYYIARELGIKSIKTMCVTSYDDEKNSGKVEHLLVDGFSEDIKNVDEWLVVDEVCDSGKTLDFVEEQYPGIKTACLYVKKHRTCDFWQNQVENDVWLNFPWEKN